MFKADDFCRQTHADIVSFFYAGRGRIMLLSISLILIVGMSMAWLCQRLRLPGLMGMLATGMILGPHALDLLDADILLVDDVLTTGATLLSCAETILRAAPDCRLSVAVLAVPQREFGLDG